ncbi:unnamed protein product [Symbiodinium natans]|uniref:Uncharacterized protein n=1 Tax=Symbiodinium natans TaxID=878477 RepID=A0A812UJA5_9DINO|nr:unnamed protein product [Symbiodinium natans]
MGRLARLAKVVERAWVRDAREAVGTEGQVAQLRSYWRGPQHGESARGARRLDLVVYGATSMVLPRAGEGEPQPRLMGPRCAMPNAASNPRIRAVWARAQRLLVLGKEVGGSWKEQAQDFLRTLTRLWGLRAVRRCGRVAGSVGAL